MFSLDLRQVHQFVFAILAPMYDRYPDLFRIEHVNNVFPRVITRIRIPADK